MEEAVEVEVEVEATTAPRTVEEQAEAAAAMGQRRHQSRPRTCMRWACDSGL